MHGCYYALTSGDIAQGLSDLTGMCASKKRFALDDKLKKKGVEINPLFENEEKKNDFWKNNLYYLKKTNSLMGCSAEGETVNN